MTFDYAISEDNGRITYICAESRKAAIKEFIKEKGCSEEFVNKHCTVKCLGVIQGWTYGWRK